MTGRNRLTRMNGAVALQSWTSSSSNASTSCTRWLQLLTGARSGTSPPASIAVDAAIRSGEADPCTSASAASACGVIGSAGLIPPELTCPKVITSTPVPAGSGCASAATRWA
jgi:hypothetical protein